LSNDKLFRWAEKVRKDSAKLSQQFTALRELRKLENDFRVVRGKLAHTMQIVQAAVPDTEAGLRSLLAEAEEALTPPQ
jgi:hypothetical protein